MYVIERVFTAISDKWVKIKYCSDHDYAVMQAKCFAKAGHTIRLHNEDDDSYIYYNINGNEKENENG